TAFQGRVQRGALPVEAADTRPHPWRRLVQPVAQAADLDHGPAEDAEQLLVGDMRVAQVDEALVVTEYCVEHAGLAMILAERPVLHQGLNIAVDQPAGQSAAADK